MQKTEQPSALIADFAAASVESSWSDKAEKTGWTWKTYWGALLPKGLWIKHIELADAYTSAISIDESSITYPPNSWLSSGFSGSPMAIKIALLTAAVVLSYIVKTTLPQV